MQAELQSQLVIRILTIDKKLATACSMRATGTDAEARAVKAYVDESNRVLQVRVNVYSSDLKAVSVSSPNCRHTVWSFWPRLALVSC